MEALAKMFFAFVNKDPFMKEGIFKSINFVMTLDQRLRAIEAKIGIEQPPLSGDAPVLGDTPNGKAHN